MLGLIPNLVLAVLVTLVIGAFAGVAWVTGYTLLGLEVADALRGRTFAFVQTMVRVVLVLVLAVAPLLAAAFGRHKIEVTEAMALTYNGAAFVFLAAGLLAAGLGVVSYRHMDDRRGVPLGADIAAAFRSPSRWGGAASGPREGFFIALEGGEGAGKSTQAHALRGWLESLGHDVVVTFEPGATEVGRRLRSVLLDHPEAVEGGAGETPAHLSPRAEALLFAADRAEHVATVVRPALELGHVVITDRYTRLVGRLPGRRPRPGRRRGGAAVALGHRRPAAAPHRAARRARPRPGWPGSTRRTGSSPSRATSTTGSGSGSSSWPGEVARATSSSTAPVPPPRSPRPSRRGSSRSSRSARARSPTLERPARGAGRA